MVRRAMKLALPEIGGDDLTVDDHPDVDLARVAIAADGTIFVAVGHYTGSPDYDEWIEVFRSTDGGVSSALWGTLNDVGERLYDIDMATGVVERVFVTYMYFQASLSSYDGRVAYTLPAAAASGPGSPN